ncbi:cyclic nucleotide-binding domain-containing protein 2-like [Physella acuta]|uniref:cyclic nucleotide-binding domain-containing protein 2-like n=1 Tax=Physella acuta TaxID=109671 RepID=UPI0027DD8BA3|nr:cyclic nucleotide-binding domain-containing protein 2-like [Physella acuta]
MSARVRSSDPPETDLDYYARPENYTGSSLKSLTRFLAAKEREITLGTTETKTDPTLKDQQLLYRRYHHILPADFCRPSPSSADDKEPPDILIVSPSAAVREDNPSTLFNNAEDNSSNDSKKHHNDGSEIPEIPPALAPNEGTNSAFITHLTLANSATRLSSRRSSLASVRFGSSRSRPSSGLCATRRLALAEKFKKLSIAVKNVLKLAKAIIKTSDSTSALLKTFTSLSKEQDADNDESSKEHMKSYGLHFDPSYFKANREISLSSEVRGILGLHPTDRTPERIQTAMFGLQSIPSFAEYPLHMQEKLAKVAWLDIVTPNRTIIRQGHFAENFYFIVTGQALVTIHRPGDTSAQTAAMMRKGTSFGELALLHHSRRTATVTSHDTVTLLSVGREDFFDIFMSRQGIGETPEHIRFISQLEFMKDWPLERLLERPDQCLLHFFKRNMVILKDSTASDWLYVVKSGSCQVLKQLKGVTARVGRPREPTFRSISRLDRTETTSHQASRNDNSSSKKLRTSNSIKKHNQSSAPGENSHSDSRVRTCARSLKCQQGSRSSNTPRVPQDENKTGRRTTQPDPSKTHQPTTSISQTRHYNQPVFVQIELLKPMDVFGLDRVNFNSNLDTDSTSVSLVSLGAECIMLSKGFFMKHANDKVKKRFSEIVQPYPNEATLQESLQHKVNWELYKRSILVNASPKLRRLQGKSLPSF